MRPVDDNSSAAAPSILIVNDSQEHHHHYEVFEDRLIVLVVRARGVPFDERSRRVEELTKRASDLHLAAKSPAGHPRD